VQQWFTLTDQGDSKAVRRSRSGLLTEAHTQRMPERQVCTSRFPLPAF